MAPFKLAGFLSSDSTGPRKTSQGAPPPANQGIQVLHDDDNAVIDILAVHGLGANPSYAWVWQPKNNPPGRSGYPKEHFNWLKELLPTKLAQAEIPCRVMTYNYSSDWFKSDQFTRLTNMSDNLLRLLSAHRKKQGRNRPLIFIGHSLGGIVIEQALVSATFQYSQYASIAEWTAGVVFLGTPFRGCAAASWGVLAASLAPSSSDKRILKELEEYSWISIDRLQQFSAWLFTVKVPAACFFEEHVTDFSSRVGLPLRTLVVPEESACIHGHFSESLPADHFKINKFYGPEDPSFQRVYPQIVRIARDAEKTLRHRRANNHDSLNYLREKMKVKHPSNILDDIKMQKGERAGHTCHWILKREEFSTWRTSKSSQLLCIVGSPGSGKTMMSTFLVEILTKEAEAHPNKAFIYFHCDKKVQSRRTSTAILRSLMWQLLLQRKELSRYINTRLAIQKEAVFFDTLFKELSTLWGLFTDMLRDKGTGEVLILVDALDECEAPARETLLILLRELFEEEQTVKVKLLVTYRPMIRDIDFELYGLGPCLKMGASSGVNSDLYTYINESVDGLAWRRSYGKDLKDNVREALCSRAGGTFLWVSSMLSELENTDKMDVRTKLSKLPSVLGEAYSEILNQNIVNRERKEARFLLLSLLAAQRPLKRKELAAAFALHKNGSVLESESVQNYLDICSSCSSIVDIAGEDDEATVDFCHQSVKDFLLQRPHGSSVEWFHTSLENANLHMFELCRRYMNGIGSIEGSLVRKHDAKVEHCYRKYPFFEYASNMCEYHAAACSTLQKPKTENGRRPPQLGGRDTYKDIIRQLLDTDQIEIKVQTNDGWTLLHKAAGSGQRGVAQLLLNADQLGVSSNDRSGKGHEGLAQSLDFTLGSHGRNPGLVRR